MSEHPKVVEFPTTEMIDPPEGAVILAAKEKSMVMRPVEFNETEIELQEMEGGTQSAKRREEFSACS